MRRMPFGKHKGERLADVPDDYLRWLAAQEFLREPLASAVEEELSARDGDGEAQAQDGVSVACIRLNLPRHEVVIARELVQLGRRSAAQRHHPDTGGDTGKMTLVNATADKLLAALGGVN